MAKGTSTLPVLAGGAALLLLSQKKKGKTQKSGETRWGIRVSVDCKRVEVVNPKLFNQFMFGAFNELVEIDPTLSLIQMTDALFGDVAPHCRGFPEDPGSSDVAELYAVVARNIGQFMVEDPRVNMNIGSLVDEATKIAFIDWYRAWRNYPSSEIPEAPADQVAFSSDFSSIHIGPDWYRKTVIPFVKGLAEHGTLDSAFEEFVSKLGVLVGQFVMPISELPQDRESVIQFLDRLEEAIESAQQEIGA